MEWLIVLALYLIPMYIANSSAMLFGGGPALDFGKTFFDGKPFLGKGKTFRGTLAGIFFGALSTTVIVLIIPGIAALLSPNFVFFGFLAALGAVLGDLVGSFFKRRAGLKPGKEFFLLDQLDFLFGGMVLSLIEFVPSLEQAILAVVITLVLHRITNFVAFKIKLKRVPW